MDMDGRWGWEKVDAATLAEIRSKLRDFESMRWEQIGKDSHYVSPASIVREAANRLKTVSQGYDLDLLYSLRLTGKKRVWGFKKGDVLAILWWDPRHEVYPSAKKNT